MVKNLADELTDILNRVENPGLGEHAHEEANTGLVIFCRGLVCGLRAGSVQTEDPEAAQRSLNSMGKVDARFRGGLRPTDEDMRIRHSIGEALKDSGFTPDCP
jgi:hypothetical protein